jgi:predicted metalloprotease with PDZ domain
MQASALIVLAASAVGTTPVRGQAIADVRYDVVFNAETALRRQIHVEMSFAVPDAQPVALSLPSWTPGSYETDDYSRNVSGLWARQNGVEVRWDMADFDTWRVYPEGRGEITVGFDYLADDLDVQTSWSKPDFVYFNGTNIFFFPDGGDLSFPSRVTFHTEPDWKVVTAMTEVSTREFSASDYHELVDKPTFVGRFDVDSARVDGRWHRLASYPEGALAGAARATLWDQIQKMMPPLEAVIGEVPFDRYTTLLVFDQEYGAGAALEHADSHLGVYHPGFIGSPVLALITAHEIFHAWNVKRIRPADMWPYDYSRRMPTELLWVSEGITDYYADLALVRGKIVSPEYFYTTTRDKIDEIRGVPPVALEDASLSAWVSPRDGTADIYYSKGSLAGLMLDILIRDASDNRRSLDDVMATLYRMDYLHGKGFTEEDLWGAIGEAAGGRAFDDFHDAYVDGRDPYPWGEVLPLAGLRIETDVDRTPVMGVTTTVDKAGIVVANVDPDGAAAAAGVRVGDHIVSVGGSTVEDAGFGARFRAAFMGSPPGTGYDVVVQRGDERLTLRAELRFAESSRTRLLEDEAAGAKARRIRNGILTGTVER